MEIRHAKAEDLDRIMEIYAHARIFMAEHGNPKQWGATNWPPKELIWEDIHRGHAYVCTVKEQVCCVFYYDYGVKIEPTYDTIEEGYWDDVDEYGVVHRIASDNSIKGIGRYCIQWALAQCGYLRIDTHCDNVVMQNLLQSMGFQKKGIIYVAQDNDPRIAYSKRKFEKIENPLA